MDFTAKLPLAIARWIATSASGGVAVVRGPDPITRLSVSANVNQNPPSTALFFSLG
jgi:hypothetical protein